MKPSSLFTLFLTFSISPASLLEIYTFVWNDEFDYTGLPDPAKWGYDVGGGGWGNNELQYYTENRLENARVENGNLTIEAIKEPYGGRQYTSTRLISKNKGDWLYGRFDIRAKLPYGRGTWPAIWMLPTDWVYGGWPRSGEIDIMEHVGYDMQTIHGTVHTLSYYHSIGTQVGSSILAENVDTAFHTYSIDWRPNRIDAFIDGQIYFTFSNEGTGFAEWPFDQRFHLLMNIAVGGGWGGAQGVDDTIFPQRLEVDYVRVYSIDDYDYTPAQPIPGIIEVESFSDHFGVRLEETSDSGGGINAGYLAHNDWMEFKLDVPATGLYSISVRGASPSGITKLMVEANGQQFTSGAIPATGDWQNWATASVGQIQLPKGESTVRITIDAPIREDLNINWFDLQLVEANPEDGIGVFEDYPLIGDWVDTGDYMGWVNVADYPWVYIYDLANFAYANDQWFYMPR